MDKYNRKNDFKKFAGSLKAKSEDYERLKKQIDCTPAAKYLGENHKKISPLQVISLITEHEVFHEGELALYYISAKIRFPGNWMAWGLI